MPLTLFTDGSVNTRTKIGFGAYLAIKDMSAPNSITDDQIKRKRFENTSSTKLELQTFLWALSETPENDLIVYTDSQNILSLLNRRRRLEKSDFYNKAGNRLKNHELYKDFYITIDSRNIQIIQIKGHMPQGEKSTVDRLFSLVDKAARAALRTGLRTGLSHS